MPFKLQMLLKLPYVVRTETRCRDVGRFNGPEGRIRKSLKCNIRLSRINQGIPGLGLRAGEPQTYCFDDHDAVCSLRPHKVVCEIVFYHSFFNPIFICKKTFFFSGIYIQSGNVSGPWFRMISEESSINNIQSILERDSGLCIRYNKTYSHCAKKNRENTAPKQYSAGIFCFPGLFLRSLQLLVRIIYGLLLYSFFFCSPHRNRVEALYKRAQKY